MKVRLSPNTATGGRLHVEQLMQIGQLMLVGSEGICPAHLLSSCELALGEFECKFKL